MKLTLALLQFIRDSRGEKTIEVTLKSGRLQASASVPHGKSRGSGEVFLLAPEKAKSKMKEIKGALLAGRDFRSQKEFDQFLLKLDGTKDKRRLGGNVILGLSLAFARLEAAEQGIELYEYIAKQVRSSSGMVRDRFPMPKPLFNVINGGLHSASKQRRLIFQEFLVIPQTRTFAEAFLQGQKFYGILKQALYRRFGQRQISLGDEAGFSVPFMNDEEALQFLAHLIKAHRLPFRLGVDAAATSFKELKVKHAWGVDEYIRLAKKFHLIFLEDPFGEDDCRSFRELTAALKREKLKTLVVGDDLTTTNPRRVREAAGKKAGNAFIMKPNQVGTITETLEAVREAKRRGWAVVASHRSGETRDYWIADMAVAVGAWGIKAGAPATPYRLSKYRRLLRIEKSLF